MAKFTPQIVLSYQKCYKFISFLKQNVLFYTDSLGMKFQYFSKNLPYSDSQFSKYFNNVDDSKNLKIHDLICILDNLPREYQFEILNWFSQNYSFTLIDSEKEQLNKDTLETLLLKITSTNGDLSKEFLQACEDNILTNDEKQNLQVLAVQFRSLLRTFENRIGNID